MKTEMLKKVGILGGTFDPVHYAHLIVAEDAREQFQLDTILLMPSGEPPHKNDRTITSSQHRLKMVQLAIEDNGYLKASDFEIRRAGITYTADTLSLLHQEHPECRYYFIVGSDSLFQMEYWHEPDRIFSSAVVLAAVREVIPQTDMQKKADELIKRFGGEIYFLQTPYMDISSSLIRTRMKQKQTIKYFVPKDVEKYIYQNHLYEE